MNNQLAIDLFTPHERENNRESQTILENNIPVLKGQCVTVFNALMRGEVLTTAIALNKYAVGDLRARLRDIRNTVIKVNGKEETFRMHQLTKSDRYKTWWMSTDDITINKILLEQSK